MKKYKILKKLTSAFLAATTLLTMTCTTSFALASSEGGAELHIGSTVTHYEDISKAWSAAVASDEATKIVLKQDWTADSDGSFGEGEGFKNGTLHLVNKIQEFTFDLNGFKVDRGLTRARSNGYLMYIYNSNRFSIIDSSDEGTGLITGCYNEGNGGAFNIEASRLTLKNIRIENNISEKRGGAIYAAGVKGNGVTHIATVFLDNCTLKGNKAKTGGAVYMDSAADIEIYDTSIIGNYACADAGVHTEVSGFDKGSVTLGGKVTIADNLAENDGTGLMLDENFFFKVYVEYNKERPLDKASRIVILSKTDDRTLRITDDSQEHYLECYEYENDKYEIIAKGSGDSKYLDIKKA